MVHGDRRHTLQHKHLGHGEYRVWIPNVFSNQLVKMVASVSAIGTILPCVVKPHHALSHWWLPLYTFIDHYNNAIMDVMAYQITSRMIVYWTVYSGADQRKHQSSASLVFVRGNHRWPVNSPHKWPVMRKMFPFNGVIIRERCLMQRYNMDDVAWLKMHFWTQYCCIHYIAGLAHDYNNSVVNALELL